MTDGHDHTNIARECNLILYPPNEELTGTDSLKLKHYHFESPDNNENELWVEIHNEYLEGHHEHKLFGRKQLTLDEAVALTEILSKFIGLENERQYEQRNK